MGIATLAGMRESHYAILVHNSEIFQVSVLQDEHNASWKICLNEPKPIPRPKLRLFHFQSYSSA